MGSGLGLRPVRGNLNLSHVNLSFGLLASFKLAVPADLIEKAIPIFQTELGWPTTGNIKWSSEIPRRNYRKHALLQHFVRGHDLEEFRAWHAFDLALFAYVKMRFLDKWGTPAESSRSLRDARDAFHFAKDISATKYKIEWSTCTLCACTRNCS